MPLRDGEDHRVFHRTGVELRRANEVADVLEHDEIQLVRPDLAQPLLGHARVEVAHAARVQLDGLHARLADRPRVDVRVNVRLHHAHAQLAPQALDRTQERRRLAAAGRGHQVQQERPLLSQRRANARRLAVVVGKDALLDLDNLVFFHTKLPQFP